jgi:hypothetical protein
MQHGISFVEPGKEDPVIHNAGGGPTGQDPGFPEKVGIRIKVNGWISFFRGNP